MIPPVATAQERQSVKAVLAADPAVVERILPLLRASLDAHGLDLIAVNAPRIDPLDVVRITPDRSPNGPVAYLWLDLVAKQPNMVLVDARSGLVHVRSLAVQADPDRVETELIRFVVLSSVEAILKGQALGVSREEFKRSLEPPPATTPTNSAAPTHPRSRWTIAAGYSGAMLTDNAIMHGPELGVGWRQRRLHLSVTLLQKLPMTVTRSEVGTHLVSSGLRIVASLPATLGSHLLATFGLGAGVDVTHLAPSGSGATAAFWATDPLVLAMATINRTWGNAFVSIRAGVEFDLLATRYLVTRPDGTSTLWTPWRWRPFAATQLGYAF